LIWRVSCYPLPPLSAGRASGGGTIRAVFVAVEDNAEVSTLTMLMVVLNHAYLKK
jgi:hypothetical protein